MADVARITHADSVPHLPTPDEFRDYLTSSFKNLDRGGPPDTIGFGTLSEDIIATSAADMGNLVRSGDFAGVEKGIQNLLQGQHPTYFNAILGRLQTEMSGRLSTSNDWGVDSIKYDPASDDIVINWADKARQQTTVSWFSRQSPDKMSHQIK
jgi:hypothetical protein